MKQKNAPANKGKQLVSFTHEDAQRINAAVAANERARRGRNPSSLPRAVGGGGGGGGGLQKALFVGSWMRGQEKTIVIVGDQTATANCTNGIVDVLYSDVVRNCFVQSSGDTYSLVIPECVR